MIFFDLWSVASESFFYGILLAAVTVAVMCFVLQMISRTCVKTVPFYLSVTVLVILLVIQDTLLIAAFKANDMVSTVEMLVQQQIEACGQTLNIEDAESVLDRVVQEVPLLGIFVNMVNVKVDNAQDLASAVAAQCHDYLNAYIWRRIGWCSAVIVVAVLIIVLADKRNVKAAPSANRRATAASGRTSHRHSARSGRRHRF